MLVISIALVALLAAGVAVLGVVAGGGEPRGQSSGRPDQSGEQGPSPQQEAARRGPITLPAVPAPQAGSAECAAVLGALPPQLLVGPDPLPRRPVADPAPPGALAWGDAGHDPVVVRCGLEAPAELQPTSQLTDVSGVEWLPLSGGGTTTWVAVDRPVRTALTVPDSAGTGPLQDVSAVLGRTLPKEPVFG